MRPAALALAIVGALATAAAAAPSPEPAVGGKSVREDVYPRAPVAFAGGVTALPDVEFANLVGFRPLLMDIYRPSAAPKPHPIVLWIHGGGWNRGDSRESGAFTDYPAALAGLAARGYLVASVNYRLTGEARFPAQVQDVNAAILFLKAHAAAYGGDPGRVFLWGGSAGGQLAALAALTCGDPAYRPDSSGGRLTHGQQLAVKPPSGSTCVQGLAAWYGVFDLPALQAVDASALLGCQPKTCPDVAAKASPVNRVGPSAPPTLLVHGLADTEVSPDQSKEMAARLEQAGVKVETLYIPGVDHGLIGKTPDATRAATLQALRATYAFFDRLSGQAAH
ncbi:MAG TPA: alpha/beta hydrolase [Caulobacteraceae bacterium]